MPGPLGEAVSGTKSWFVTGSAATAFAFGPVVAWGVGRSWMSVGVDERRLGGLIENGQAPTAGVPAR